MPSQHDHYGLTSTAADTLTVIGKTAGGATSGAAAVSSLLSTAGVSAVAAPPASWIVAAGAAAAAGTIALVISLKKRAVSKDAAVAMAQKLGFPDAAAIPGYTLRALEWSSSKRARKAATYERRIARRVGTRRDWWSWRAKLKLTLLGVIEAVDMVDKREVASTASTQGTAAAARLQAQQQAQLEAAAVEYGARQQKLIMGIAIAGGVGLLGLVILRSRLPAVRANRRRRNGDTPKKKRIPWWVVGLGSVLAAGDAVTPGFPFPGSAAVMVPLAGGLWVAKLAEYSGGASKKANSRRRRRRSRR